MTFSEQFPFTLLTLHAIHVVHKYNPRPSLSHLISIPHPLFMTQHWTKSPPPSSNAVTLPFTSSVVFFSCSRYLHLMLSTQLAGLDLFSLALSALVFCLSRIFLVLQRVNFEHLLVAVVLICLCCALLHLFLLDKRTSILTTSRTFGWLTFFFKRSPNNSFSFLFAKHTGSRLGSLYSVYWLCIAFFLPLLFFICPIKKLL